jgi:hypothetical protein
MVPDPQDTFTFNNGTIEIKPEKRQLLKDLRNLLENGESTSLPSSVETALDDGLSTSNDYEQVLENVQAAARNSYKALYYRALVQEPRLMKPSDGPAYVVPHHKSQVSRMVVEACKRFGSGFLEYEKTSSPPDLPLLSEYKKKCLRILSVDAKNYLLRTADVVEHKVGPDEEFIKTYTPHFAPKVELVQRLQEIIEKLQNGIEPGDGELRKLYQLALDQAYVRRKDVWGCLVVLILNFVLVRG